MKETLHKLYVLCIREIKRNFRNVSYLITLSMPLIITLLYYQFFAKNVSLQRLSFSLFANLNVLTITLISMTLIVYTDKESHAEQQLRSAGVSQTLQFVSKGCITLAWVVFYQIALCLLYKISIIPSLKIIALSIIFTIVMQVLVALLCYKNSNASLVSNIITLVYTLLLLMPEFQGFYNLISYFSKLIPSYYTKLWFDSLMGLPTSFNAIHFVLVFLLWLLVPIAIMKQKKLPSKTTV